MIIEKPNHILEKGELFNDYIKKTQLPMSNGQDFLNFLQGGIVNIEKKDITEYRAQTTETLFPSEVLKKIVKTMEDEAFLLKLCSQMRVYHKFCSSILVDNNEYKGSWKLPEGELESDESKNLDRLDIYIHTLETNVVATSSIIENTQLDEWIVERTAKSFGHSLSKEIIIGDGKNKPYGILNRALKEPNITGKIEIKKIEEGSLFQDLVSACFSLPSIYAKGAVWIMPKSFLTILSKDIIQKKPHVFSYDSTGSDAYTMKFLGYPVYISDALEEEKCCLFGNLKETYLYLLEKEVSTLRDPYSKKGFIQFYTTTRVGGDVINSKSILVCQMNKE